MILIQKMSDIFNNVLIKIYLLTIYIQNKKARRLLDQALYNCDCSELFRSFFTYGVNFETNI